MSDHGTWYNVVIQNVSASRAIEIKDQLIADGLSAGKDFEWWFSQSSWNTMTGATPSQTKFGFREEKLATFYRLKWQISTL